MEEQEKVRRALIGLLIAFAISISIWALGFFIVAMTMGSPFGSSRDGAFLTFITGHRFLIALMAIATIVVVFEGYRIVSRWLDSRRKRDSTERFAELATESDRAQPPHDKSEPRSEGEASPRHQDFHSTL